MRLTRCFIDAPLSPGAILALPDTATTHLTRALRLGPGARFALFNGDGHDYEAELAQVDRHGASAEVIAARRVDSESPLTLVLAQAVARGEKMDFVLQKAAELGVAGIVPLVTERTEVRLDAERSEKRRAHWQGILAAACEQCGRARLPALGPMATLANWLTGAPAPRLDARSDSLGQRLPLFYLDPDAETTLRDLPDAARAGACFVIGPEGGLGERDLALLRASGAIGIRLGPRVLRTETAGLALLAAMQALYGDF